MTVNERGRWVAIVTGVFSVAIGVIYLLLITVLDSRRSLIPPPSEAYVEEAAVAAYSVEEVLPPFS